MSEKALPPARHETRDVGFAPMLVAGVLMLVALGLMLGLALVLFPGSTRDKPTLNANGFAGPVLQPSPAADMAAFYAGEMARLNGAGWNDASHGSAHIPIADAMRDVARAGIPDWPTHASRPGAAP